MTILTRLFKALASRTRQLVYGIMGVQILGHCSFGNVSIPRNFRSIKISRHCGLDDRVTLLSVDMDGRSGRISIGERTYINRNTIIDACDDIQIGDDCAIGPNCYITDHDHGFDFKTAPLQLPLKSKATIIGNRVWIGANSVILKGVVVHDGAVIGAGSVVTRDVLSSTVVAGVPAKQIR